MRRKLACLFGLLVLVLGLSGCVSSGPETIELAILSPEEGAHYDVLNPDVSSFLKDYTVGSSEKYYNKTDNDETIPVNVKWDGADDVSEYTLTVADNKALEGCVKYTTASTEYNLRNLVGDTRYYIKVSAKSNDEKYIYESPAIYFDTEPGPRIITADGVKNIRDLGGNGIRYGLVYRSAKLDDVTINGISTLTGELGIRTDLDLRAPDETGGIVESPLGEGINYINIDGVMYLGAMDSEEGRETMRQELMVFAEDENYPIDVHCIFGRDRTGTLVFTLKALCGVEAEDIMKDYELSMLSSGAHTKRTVSSLIQDIEKFERRMRGYGLAGDSLQHCAELYVKSCGLTDDDIDNIRSILTGEE